MRTLIVLFLLTLLMSSCNKKNEEQLPVIDRDQMVNILADIHLVEAKLNYEKKKDIKENKLTEKYYESVFSKYNVSEEEFEESLYYYKKDVEVLDQIYSDVITKLSKIQSEVNDKLDPGEEIDQDTVSKVIILGKKKVRQNTKP